MVQLHGDARDYAWGPGGLDTIITQVNHQMFESSERLVFYNLEAFEST